MVVGPRPEFQKTRLLVEGKVGDVDLARAAQSGWGSPEDHPVAVHHGVRRHVTGGKVVCATKKQTIDCKQELHRWMTTSPELVSLGDVTEGADWCQTAFVHGCKQNLFYGLGGGNIMIF